MNTAQVKDIRPMMGINIASFSQNLQTKKASVGKKTKLSELDLKAAKKAYHLYRESGKTQAQIANEINVSQGNLSQYFNGAQPIGAKVLSKLCKVFNCMPYDIRSEFKDPESETELTKVNNRISQHRVVINSLIQIIEASIANVGSSYRGIVEEARLALSVGEDESSPVLTKNIDSIQKNIVNKNGYRFSQSDLDAAAAVYKMYKESKLTQQKLAAKMNMTQGNLSQYLNAKMPFGSKILLRFCAVFDCQPGDIRSEYRDIALDNQLSSAVIQLKNQKDVINKLLNAVKEQSKLIKLSEQDAINLKKANAVASKW
jgi:transcriptional regulator with XRE-family HTH domain